MEHMAQAYCRRLVADIEHAFGRSLSSSLRDAFLQIPRHAFVHYYYEQRNIKIAPPCSNEPAWDAWLSAVYRDRALTTQLDQRGFPTSSSTQPSVMTLMIEELALAPGMRVLEIGTGTGYNAALLAKLVNQPSLITTIDLDPTLIDLARSRIEELMGTGMTLSSGNGIAGYEPNAPYDRIIATGRYLPVPQAWIEQLVPGGRLVMDLGRHIGGGLITVIKHADGTATGRFFTKGCNVRFMDLRSSLETLATPALLSGYQQFPVQESLRLTEHDQAYPYASHFCTYEQFHSTKEEFHIWLQWRFPDLGIKWKGSLEHMYAVLTNYAAHTVATIQQQADNTEIVVRGNHPLWLELEQVYQDWCTVGKPGRECYTLFIDRQGRQTMKIEYQDTSSFSLLETF